MLECPSRFWMDLKFTPFEMHSPTCVCLKSWNLVRSGTEGTDLIKGKLGHAKPQDNAHVLTIRAQAMLALTGTNAPVSSPRQSIS